MNSLTLQTLRERKNPDLRLLVIGDPIDHSLSPPMHNAALEFLHLPCVYGRLRVGPKNLREAFKILRQQDFIGWNLTLPHKLMAIDLLDGLDPVSERLRSVNTVVNQSGRLFGFNTDGKGLVTAIGEAFGCAVPSVRVALLGAGGGAGGVPPPVWAIAATGSVRAATAPANVITIDSTAAKIGRSMKKCENITALQCPYPDAH